MYGYKLTLLSGAVNGDNLIRRVKDLVVSSLSPTENGFTPDSALVRTRLRADLGKLVGTVQDLRIYVDGIGGIQEQGSPMKRFFFNICLPGENSVDARILINAERIRVTNLKQLAAFKVATLFTREEFSAKFANYEPEVPEVLYNEVIQWF